MIPACIANGAPGGPVCGRSDGRSRYESHGITFGVEGTVDEVAGSAAVDEEDAIAVAHVAADAGWGGGPDVVEVLVHLIFPFGLVWVWGRRRRAATRRIASSIHTCFWLLGWSEGVSRERMECVKSESRGSQEVIWWEELRTGGNARNMRRRAAMELPRPTFRRVGKSARCGQRSKTRGLVEQSEILLLS